MSGDLNPNISRCMGTPIHQDAWGHQYIKVLGDINTLRWLGISIHHAGPQYIKMPGDFETHQDVWGLQYINPNILRCMSRCLGSPIHPDAWGLQYIQMLGVSNTSRCLGSPTVSRCLGTPHTHQSYVHIAYGTNLQILNTRVARSIS